MLSQTKVVVTVVRPVAIVVMAQALATVKVVVVSLLSAVTVVVKAVAALTAKAAVVHVVKMAQPHHVVVTHNDFMS